MALRAIIFDLDGVLINSEFLMKFAYKRALKNLNCPEEIHFDLFLALMGKSMADIVSTLGLPPAFKDEYERLSKRHMRRIPLYPGTKDLLKNLSSLNLKIGVFTGKDRYRTIQILDHLGITPFLQSIVTSDDVRKSKPDPDGLNKILADFQVRPQEAILIGDSVSDVQCAKHGGVKSVAVIWGIKPDRVLNLCSPDYVISHWNELEHLIEGMLNKEKSFSLQEMAS